MRAVCDEARPRFRVQRHSVVARLCELPSLARVALSQRILSHEPEYTEQRLARRGGIVRQAFQALRIEAPLLRIALTDATAIFFGGGRGHFEEDAAALARPGIEHLIAATPLDHRDERI